MLKSWIEKNKKTIYILPVLLLLLAVAYRNYRFYLKDQGRVYDYIGSNFHENQYELVQTQHPYYLIYQIAKLYRNDPSYTVVYFNTNREKRYIDYNSTLYAAARDIKGKSEDRYLTETNLMLNYYFYPRLIPVIITDKDLGKLIKKKEKLIVVSDMDFAIHRKYLLTTFKHIEDPYDETKRVSYRQTENFYIYQK